MLPLPETTSDTISESTPSELIPAIVSLHPAWCSLWDTRLLTPLPEESVSPDDAADADEPVAA